MIGSSEAARPSLSNLEIRLLEKAETDEDSEGLAERRCARRLERRGLLTTKDAATFAGGDALSLWLTQEGEAALERERGQRRNTR